MLSPSRSSSVARITSFAFKNCNSTVKKSEDFNDDDKILLNNLNNRYVEYINFLNNEQIDKGLKIIFELMSDANAYIDNQAPWKLIKSDSHRMNVVLFTVLNIIRGCSLMLMPVIPESANKVLDILNIDNTERYFKNINQIISKDIKINEPIPIFPRIE